MERQDQALNAAAFAAARALLYISATIFGIVWLLSSKLDPDTIEICREACTSTSTKMESVTSKECICTGSDINNNWVLPK